MQVDTGCRKLKARRNPQLGLQLAQGSIYSVDDAEPSSDDAESSPHQIAAFATSFRHSVMASEARSTRRGSCGSIRDIRR